MILSLFYLEKKFNFIKKYIAIHSTNVISILLKRMQIYHLRGKCFKFFKENIRKCFTFILLKRDFQFYFLKKDFILLLIDNFVTLF